MLKHHFFFFFWSHFILSLPLLFFIFFHWTLFFCRGLLCLCNFFFLIELDYFVVGFCVCVNVFFFTMMLPLLLHFKSCVPSPPHSSLTGLPQVLFEKSWACIHKHLQDRNSNINRNLDFLYLNHGHEGGLIEMVRRHLAREVKSALGPGVAP